MTATQAPPTFSSADVCRQTGVSYRQLDWWARTGYLQPIQPESGSGKGDHIRCWTQDELDRAAMMARLVRLGVTAQQAAKVARDPTCRWGWLADVMAACKAMQP